MTASGRPRVPDPPPDPQPGGARAAQPDPAESAGAGTHPPDDVAMPGGTVIVGGHTPGDSSSGDAFASLDSELPLLLLPIRIETRYVMDADPPELRIRIFPDQIHIDADSPAASPTEQALTTSFWRTWHATPEARDRPAIWRRYARQVGGARAGHLARMLRPRVDQQGALTFPTVTAGAAAAGPARASLLPGRWLAVAYDTAGEVLFERQSEPVPDDLRTGPDPDAPGIHLAGSDLRIDDGIAWMFEYDRAVEAGMAITVPLTGATAAATAIATLLVVGVVQGDTPAGTAQRLDALLGAHARTDGLAFLAQGTPTNNTRTADAGVPPPAPAPAPLIPPILTPPLVPIEGARAATEPMGDFDPSGSEIDPSGFEVDPVPTGSGDNAARLASALGLADTATLARVPLGTDAERGRSRAMLRVLYRSIYGMMTESLLQVRDADGMSDAARAAMKDWCLQYVTGGAPYPTVRVGAQPYGVLPVCRSTTVTDPSGTADRVRQVVALLIDAWRRAAGTLPRMDPNQTDVPGGGDPSSAVATVLATAPHPARLFLRRLESYELLDVFSQMVTPQWWYSSVVLGGLDLTAHPDLESPHREIASTYWFIANSRTLDTIDAQIAVWNDVAGVLPNYLGGADTQLTRDGLAYVDNVIAILSGYASRQDPVGSLDLANYAGAIGAENTTLIEALLFATSDEWPADGLVQARDAAAGHTTADYLTDLRDRLDAAGDTVPPSSLDDDFLAAQPLLYQLIDRTLPRVAAGSSDERSQYLEALDALVTRTPTELLWLMRECLGLSAHRLDAWATSVATERVHRIRERAPVGIQIGAFGWVSGLAPRSTARSSDGYVHTPSMAHATTAALLRTGWLVHGNDDPQSAVAVNAASARVRDAGWLLDGVRGGVDLGDLLGYRFERSLHDLGADAAIGSIRRAVLDADGRTGAAPDQPVDGIALLDLYRAGGLSTMEDGVSTALADLEAVFDATNDVGMVEAVHQLAAGNNDRAGAMLDALTGVTVPPELRAPRTPRTGVSVEHRVLLLLDPQAPPLGRGWAPGLRDRVAPALEAWLQSVLPPADTIGFSVDHAGTAVPMTLHDLGLSAMDAVYLIGADPDVVAPAFRTIAAAHAGATEPVTIQAAARGGAPVSMQEFAVLARELRPALEPLRVADARDVRPAATPGDADTDVSAARAAGTSVVKLFGDLVTELGSALARGAHPGPLVTQLARFGIADGGAPSDPGTATAIADLATQRLETVRAIAIDPAEPGPGLRARLAALFRATVPMLGAFPMSPDAVDPGAGVAPAVEVAHWLDTVGLVRADVGRLTTAGMLSALLTADGGLRCSAGQAPVVAGEAWAATGTPDSNTGGRLSVVAITTDGGPPRPDATACGLVVDAWAERVPARTQTTGLALHFDAPSNRPPQSWLLAVAPDGEAWSQQLVLDTLNETLEWASLRAVGPEDLLEYGRAIPTAYVPGYIVGWPEVE